MGASFPVPKNSNPALSLLFFDHSPMLTTNDASESLTLPHSVLDLGPFIKFLYLPLAILLSNLSAIAEFR